MSTIDAAWGCKNADKFPITLREKIKNDGFAFPEQTELEYEPILAYRGITRKEGDLSGVTRRDFRSKAEKKEKKIRGQVIDQTNPTYYGVSLFKDKDILKSKFVNAFKFPNPRKKIAVGYIKQESGPQLTNEETTHVCWWLFEDADLSTFRFDENEDRKC